MGGAAGTINRGLCGQMSHRLSSTAHQGGWFVTIAGRSRKWESFVAMSKNRPTSVAFGGVSD